MAEVLWNSSNLSFSVGEKEAVRLDEGICFDIKIISYFQLVRVPHLPLVRFSFTHWARAR